MTREEKAIKIAEFEGWVKTGKIMPTTPPQDEYKRGDIIIGGSAHEWHYSSFNGLMEIVERVNKAYPKDRAIEILTHGICVLRDFDYGHNFFNTDHTPLIDALQSAILFYHENRGK